MMAGKMMAGVVRRTPPQLLKLQKKLELTETGPVPRKRKEEEEVEAVEITSAGTASRWV